MRRWAAIGIGALVLAAGAVIGNFFLLSFATDRGDPAGKLSPRFGSTQPQPPPPPPPPDDDDHEVDD
jgi:hypothetical protein